MEKRWASIRLTLVLFYLGVLPLTLDVPIPFAFALLTLALVVAVPLCLRFARTLSQLFFPPVLSSGARFATPGSWQLLRSVAPGARGAVRSRAPSRLLAAHG